MDPIDFRSIRSFDGSQNTGFEQLCCQLARHDDAVPKGSVFHRLDGSGGDGGVECYWTHPNGDEWGYQSKYFFQLDKEQLYNSVREALAVHPRLRKYVVCIPFDLAGPTSRRGKSQVERWEEYVEEWRSLALSMGMTVDFQRWTSTDMEERLFRTPNTSQRIKYWFGKEKLFDIDWFSKQSGLPHASWAREMECILSCEEIEACP